MKRTQPNMRHASQPAAPVACQIKAALFMLLPLVALPASSAAQALPVATASPVSTGFSLPSVAGTLQYAVSASQSEASNYYGDSSVNSSTNLSGDLAFITTSQLYPFNMVFSGGRAWSSSGQSAYDFFNLAMTQGIHTQRWTFVLSDSVSYLPGTASSGLSGVPGVGDLGVNPVQPGTTAGTGAPPSQGVLTGYSSRVSNSISLSIARPITGKTSFSASGSYAITRFVNDSNSTPGLDSNNESGSLGISHRIDARDSAGGNYSYTRSTFPGANAGLAAPAFSSQSVSVQYSRQFTRKFGISASAGPAWNNTDTPGSTSTHSLYANLSAIYAGKFSQAAMAYTHSTNSGYGVVGGALSDSVSFSTGRTLDRVWQCSFTAAYSKTSELPSAASLPFTFHTTVLGVQVSRAIVRSLSAYASYTLQHQTNQGAAAAVDLFSGLSNVTGFGLTYSPMAIRLGHS
ncbi:MAG: hypothetical protein ACLQM6_03535 [Acidobacteriaceae bacterium]